MTEQPILHSHTHCRAAQANATTQAWQRVWLSHRTTKTTNKPADEKEHRSDNSVYVAIAGEVVNRRSVHLRNFVPNGRVCASNPLLHIHAKPLEPMQEKKTRRQIFGITTYFDVGSTYF